MSLSLSTFWGKLLASFGNRKLENNFCQHLYCPMRSITHSKELGANFLGLGPCFPHRPRSLQCSASISVDQGRVDLVLSCLFVPFFPDLRPQLLDLCVQTLCYMLCFYTIHMFWFNGSSIAFAVMFPMLFSIAFITAKHWNALAMWPFSECTKHSLFSRLFRFFTEHQADMEAAKLSQGHTRGGREFYSKFLLRNRYRDLKVNCWFLIIYRILRELIEDGEKLFTEVGDYRKAIAEYVTRCGELERTQSDNDELTLSVEGDDYPGEIWSPSCYYAQLVFFWNFLGLDAFFHSLQLDWTISC